MTKNHSCRFQARTLVAVERILGHGDIEMNKVVTLKFVNGSLERGFSVILQIANEVERASFQTIAQLPPAPEIPRFYHQWQTIYRSLGEPIRRVATAHRIEFLPEEATHVSSEDCDRIAEQLSKRMNSWLRAESFRPAREGLLENLKRTDEIRLLLQTEDVQLKRLPWHLWDFFDRYQSAEIALSLSKYKRGNSVPSTSSQVKILAVLGNSSGINIEADRILLERLPNAKVRFCVKPKRQQINDRLWDEGWDVLFFAGHSSSHANGETGRIQINDRESISLTRLKYGLSRAVKNGLKLAIFNSCDGLGLAKELAQLQIPQIIVMREPVPDMVAQAFLKSFLKAFSRGVPFYLAVREARERLQGLEDRFPCATWLPIICQHPVLHTLMGVFGTALALPWVLGEVNTQIFMRLMLVSQSAPVSSKALLMVAHMKPLFWQSIEFFTILGLVVSFWLGVSYYIVLPRLSGR